MGDPSTSRDAIPKEELLRSLGYGGELEPVERELVVAGLSRPDKANIARAKRERVAELLAESFVLVCNRGDCRAEAESDERTVAPAVRSDFCEICGGSPVSAAVREMEAACSAGRVRRIVVLGGSPNVRTRLRDEVGPGLELHLVDGTEARTVQRAKDDLAWADLIVIWAGTELAHKATEPYPAAHPRTIVVARRGIPALARAVAAYARKRGPAG